MQRYVCPACGAEMLGPSMLCSGSFLDTDHPANVQPIVAQPPISDVMQDVKRAAYDAKVREMRDAS